MSFTIERAIEQWSLSGDTSTSIFSQTAVIIPFATRDTNHPDLGNTISSGVITLHANTKADWTACQVTLGFRATSSTSVVWSMYELKADGTRIFFDSHAGSSTGNGSMRTPWFDHTSYDELSMTVRASDISFGAQQDTPTDAIPVTFLQLEFR